MDNVLSVFSNPIVIVIICVAFGFPILAGIVKLIQKKFFPKNTRQARANAQHVRDAVKKYDEETQEIKKGSRSEKQFPERLLFA